MLEQQINDAFMTAYKAKQELEISVLRMMKSALQNKKIEKLIKKEDELPDADAIAVLKSEVKKRLDSIESYKAGGREELAAREQSEIEIIKKYLPSEMDESKVRGLVLSAIAEQGNPGPSGFGKIMSSVMAKAAGAADGAVVSRILKEELAK